MEGCPCLLRQVIVVLGRMRLGVIFEVVVDSTADAFRIGVIEQVIMISDESVPPGSFLFPGSIFERGSKCIGAT